MSVCLAFVHHSNKCVLLIIYRYVNSRVFPKYNHWCLHKHSCFVIVLLNEKQISQLTFMFAAYRSGQSLSQISHISDWDSCTVKFTNHETFKEIWFIYCLMFGLHAQTNSRAWCSYDWRYKIKLIDTDRNSLHVLTIYHQSYTLTNNAISSDEPSNPKITKKPSNPLIIIKMIGLKTSQLLRIQTIQILQLSCYLELH